ncbi:MAG: RnfABCDGE type electron transport complex subunit D, partial [Akkermansiaceae bacterium]
MLACGIDYSKTSHQSCKPSPWRDIRIPFAALLTGYVVLGLGWLGFSRSLWQILLTLVCAVGFDLLANRFFRHESWKFPWSGLITGLGLSLLLNFGAHPWLPILPAFLAIASKHIFTVRGKHVYNPGLFGLIVGMVLAGGMLSPAPAYQWGGTAGVCCMLGGLALFVFVRKINRSPLVLSFLGFYTLQMLLRTWLMRHHLPPETIILGTISSPPFYLFVFYMLTDPATTPSSKKGQIGLALAVTIVDMGLHLLRSYSTLFPALFIVQTAVLGFGWAKMVWRAEWSSTKTLVIRLSLITGVAGLFFWSQRPVEVNAHFVLIERRPAAMQSTMGSLLQETDPRLQHIAKWIFSVGDAVAIADIDGDGRQDV